MPPFGQASPRGATVDHAGHSVPRRRTVLLISKSYRVDAGSPEGAGAGSTRRVPDQP